MNKMEKDILLEVKHLKKYYQVKNGLFKKVNVKAVDDVSFYIRRGETLGLVGESGCGKTTLGRTILRLLEPTDGEIIFDGKVINQADMKDYRKRCRLFSRILTRLWIPERRCRILSEKLLIFISFIKIRRREKKKSFV